MAVPPDIGPIAGEMLLTIEGAKYVNAELSAPDWPSGFTTPTSTVPAL
jgi:hypothetical protein